MFEKIKSVEPEAYHFAHMDRLGFKTFVTGRGGGVSLSPYDSLNTSASNGDTPENVEENIDLIKKALGFERLWMPNQVHGDTIAVVDSETSLEPGSADAVVVNGTGTAIAVRTADCLPVILADPVTKTAAAVHAGRKSTELNIVSKTLKYMVNYFNVNPANVVAAFAPCIGSCCYEVDESTAKRFYDYCGGDGGRMIDIASANFEQLEQAGVLVSNIYDCGICSSCENDRFYSYRKDGGITGRFMTGIAIC